MADSSTTNSPLVANSLQGASVLASPQPASTQSGFVDPVSSPSSQGRSIGGARWDDMDQSAQYVQQQQLQQQMQQQVYQSEPGRNYNLQHPDMQLRHDHLFPHQQQQQQGYDTLARERGTERSPAMQHMNRQEWPGVAQGDQQQDEHHQMDHLTNLMKQSLHLQYGDQQLPGFGGPHQQPPLPTHGFHSPPIFAGRRLPPGLFPPSPTGPQPLGNGGAGGPSPLYGLGMMSSPHLNPISNFSMQAPLPMFGNSSSNNTAITRGSSPHGGQFVKVGDGSSYVSQQLDAYQEHLQAQLQIQQQLWHQQRHLEQMYILQQQQHQNNLGTNPSMFMEQPQMNPFPLMQPTGPSDPETSRNQHPRHYPVLQQDGVSRLIDNALDIEPKSMHPLPTAENEKQQAQALEIERHLSEMLFVSGNGHHARGQELGKDSRGTSTAALPTVAIGVLPKEHLSLEEIEAAQFKALQFRQHMEQTPRRSLSELVLPPEVSSTTSYSSSDPKSRGEGPSTNKKDDIPADAAVSAAVPNDSAAEAPNSVVGASGDGEKAGRRFSHLPDHHHHHHHQHRRKASVTQDTTFSIKDTNLFSVPKYDPYRPSQGTFDTITTEMKSLCEELLPNPAEETRKLSLLDRLQELANEVFGKADVLPFGSSGNGLALANADMDLCVFLPKDIKQKSLNGGKQKKEDAEVDKEQQPQDDKSTEEKKEEDQEEAAKEDGEVSPAEFVERMGNRLEEESDFRDILQLKKARVPIVKLVHSPTGIACDIGYENHLALWNTRLLRAYSRIDGRLRELVSVIKYWAKRRKINNPYVGTLSSYAYVLLIIHFLQVRGILPNLQTITADNSGRIPFWDCQGFNRYFFEDVSDLDSHWRPTTESQRETIGELLYEFFRYFVHEFRYATQVVSIRKGGLLTKDQKEWSKEFLQAENRPPSSVRSRYLFCIEDPFEVDHNVARTVDRYTLFAIRGEFMRAAKVLSRGGDNIVARLCQEKEDPPPSEEGTGHHNDDASATPGEGDEDGGGGRDDQVDDGSSAKHSRPTAFPEGDEPVRANNNGGSGSARSGRDSHYGGGKRVSSTPRDGQHHHHGNHHQNQSRLSFQQQARQHYHHNNNQSQRDSLRRASLAGGAHGSSSRDRPKQ